MTLLDKLEADATEQLDDSYVEDDESYIKDIKSKIVDKHQDNTSSVNTKARVTIRTTEHVTKSQIDNMSNLTVVRPAQKEIELMFSYSPEDVKEVTE